MLLIALVAQVEQLNGWVEEDSFHWLPLSPLQLLDWPSRCGYTHGKFGMPLCKGDLAWLVDPQNAQPPCLVSVLRWFTNGCVELGLMFDQAHDARCRPSNERRVVKPMPGVLLPILYHTIPYCPPSPRVG